MRIEYIHIEAIPRRFNETEDIQLVVTVKTMGQEHHSARILSPDDFRNNFDRIMSILTDELRQYVVDTVTPVTPTKDDA